MNQTIQILGKGVALILLLACVLSSIILGRSLQQMRKDQEGILVKGVAEMEIVSDLAMWTSSISIRSLDLAQGYALLGEQTQKALDYLKEQGIEETQIELATISVSTSYKRDARGAQTSEIDHYSLSQRITVESTDVALIKQLSKDASILISRGLGFASYAPDFYFTGLEPLKLDLLEQASANARLRADRLATSTGSRVKGIVSASQGVFQITGPHSTETSGGGLYDTSTIDKKVRAVVTMKFKLD